jgi:GT2 family glycosyltransferase/lipopolysaccharide/colanic/teichoic acid biosynthesis glycosyltransferase
VGKRVNVVIVHYRTPDLLRRCLHSLEPYLASGVGVLVVDNASGELAPRDVETEFPGVRLLAQGANLGYSKAVNLGLGAAPAEFHLVLNPDIVVREGAIEVLVAAADRRPEVGIVGPKLLNPDGSLQYSCRRFYDFKTFVYRRTPLGRLQPNATVLREHMMLDYDHAEPRVVDWVLGGAMLVRGRAVDEVGGMDERFFLYFEDVDWCYRMHQRGWRVLYDPDAEMVHHHRRESATRPLGKSFFSHLMSVFRFYEKWSLVLYLLKSQREEISRVLRLVLDVIALNAAFYGAYLIRKGLGDIFEKPVFDLSSYRNIWLFGNALALGTFYTMGFYRRESPRWDWVDRLFMVGRATGIVTVIMMATTFLLYTQSYSRAMVTIFWPLSTAFVFMGREALVWLGARVRGHRLDLPRVAVVGTPAAVEEERQRLLRRDSLDFEPIYLPDYSHKMEVTDPADPDATARFLDFVRSERIGSVYFVSPAQDGARITELVPSLTRSGVRTHLRPAFATVLSPDARVEDVGGTWVLSLGTGSRWQVRGVWKRFLDLMGASLLVVLLAFPNLLYLLGRWLGSRRPIFREEARYLHPGTPIRYRMYQPRPRRNLWQIVVLDHYPRLFAILRGTFSFVGVYPYQLEEFESLPDAVKCLSLDAPPGLTGLWWFQRGAGLTPVRIRALDVEYVQRWSNTYDLKTFLRALTALIRTRGRLPELEPGESHDPRHGPDMMPMREEHL